MGCPLSVELAALIVRAYLTGPETSCGFPDSLYRRPRVKLRAREAP